MTFIEQKYLLTIFLYPSHIQPLFEKKCKDNYVNLRVIFTIFSKQRLFFQLLGLSCHFGTSISFYNWYILKIIQRNVFELVNNCLKTNQFEFLVPSHISRHFFLLMRESLENVDIIFFFLSFFFRQVNANSIKVPKGVHQSTYGVYNGY